ncbi:MAG: hypothetical protein QM599_07365 [Pseudoxanthomonas sp.]
MENKDIKSARPSLFETGHPPANDVPGNPRSLQHPSVGSSGMTEQGRHWQRRWPWGLALLAVVAVGIIGWRVLAGSNPDRPAQPVPVPAIASKGADAEGAGSTAILVGNDEASRVEQPSLDDPLSIIRANAAAGKDAAATYAQEDARSPSPGSSMPSRAMPAAGDGNKAKSRTGSTRVSGGDTSSDLLETLLANIRKSPDGVETRGKGPQTLDELIAQLNEKPGAKPTTVASAENASSQGSARLQTQLRSCPAANTLAGIRCRQKLCEKHRGDPACPQQ